MKFVAIHCVVRSFVLSASSTSSLLRLALLALLADRDLGYDPTITPRMSPLSPLSPVAAEAARLGHTLLKEDIPTLLSLSANALKRAPFPATAEGWTTLSRDAWFQLAPLLLSLLVCAVVPLSMLLVAGPSQQGRAQNRARQTNTYWLTRVALIKGMALIYLAAFLTSAAQSRTLFGSQGLDPVVPRRPHGETPMQDIPTLALDVLDAAVGRLGLPAGESADVVLEVLSWAGVLLSLAMLFARRLHASLPLVLWGLYLSLVNLEARVVIG